MKESGKKIREIRKVVYEEIVGVLHCADDDWTEDFKNGKGVFEYANGDKYDGDWREDMPEGQGRFRERTVGTMNYATGDKYEGMWKQGKRHGNGKYLLYF